MEYITAFPDKPNGYSFNVKAAKLLDTANNLGVLFEAVTLQNQFLSKDMTKNKQAMVNNFYTMMGYYNETKAYELAIAMCDKVLELIPGEPQTMKIKESLTKNWEIIKKMQSGGNQKAATSNPQFAGFNGATCTPACRSQGTHAPSEPSLAQLPPPNAISTASAAICLLPAAVSNSAKSALRCALCRAPSILALALAERVPFQRCRR